jgi:4'-phosphopantetheinyl transferase
MSDGNSSLECARVSLWQARTDSEQVARAALELPPDLLDRLRQLPQPGQRRRIVQQALRRSVLAGYAGVESEELELAFAPGGPIASPVDGLLVSASHFDDVTALAITDCGLALGVDIEPEFEDDWDEALEMVLTETELRSLERLPEHLRPARYFELWTLKESVMKALGAGLDDMSPGSIEIDTSGPSPELASIDDQAPSGPWALWSGSLDAYILSIALQGVPKVTPTFCDWPVETPGEEC